MISRVLQACYDAHDIRNDEMHKHNRYTSPMPVIIYKSNDYLNFLFSALFRDFSENRPYSCVRG